MADTVAGRRKKGKPKKAKLLKTQFAASGPDDVTEIFRDPFIRPHDLSGSPVRNVQPAREVAFTRVPRGTFRKKVPKKRGRQKRKGVSRNA